MWVGARVEPSQLRPYRFSISATPLRAHVAGVERVEDKLDAQLLVMAVQLGEAVVVADKRPATDPVDVPHAEVVAGAVVRQVARRPSASPEQNRLS